MTTTEQKLEALAADHFKTRDEVAEMRKENEALRAELDAFRAERESEDDPPEMPPELAAKAYSDMTPDEKSVYLAAKYGGSAA